MPGELWLIRHGQTEWSRSGAHTGRTDIPLTAAGEDEARAIGCALHGHPFALVLGSPLNRARDTCRLAGFPDAAIDENPREWDYGDYEGRTTAEIRGERPNWSLWSDGVPNGETIEQVAARARAVIERVSGASGDVALFSHGHLLRVLAACWLGLNAVEGKCFALGTASISRLGNERETKVIAEWNRKT